MSVTRITAPQSDLTVVNAARVSFDKVSVLLTEGDKGLLKYLFTHKHWSPFAHVRELFLLRMDDREWLNFFARANLAGFEWDDKLEQMVGSLWAWYENSRFLPADVEAGVLYKLLQLYPASTGVCADTRDIWVSNRVCRIPAPKTGRFSTLSFRMKTSIAVARQLVKHQQKLAWNEVSRRYVDDTPEIAEFLDWRKRPDGSMKQGSSDEIFGSGTAELLLDPPKGLRAWPLQTISGAVHTYNSMVRMEIAPEQARMVLPLCTLTEWIWTGSEERFRAVLALRLDPHAQKETRIEAEALAACMN